MLSGCDFVVLCLREDAELPEFLVEVVHELLYLGLDNAEVMVVHLLSLRSLGTEECPSGVLDVRALIVHLLCDEEVLLLGSDGCVNVFRCVVAEELQDTERLLVQSLHGSEQRCLLIESLACV